MTRAWRSLRRRILTPDTSETLLDVRGFHKKSPAAQAMLEQVGATFLTGYGDAAEAAAVAGFEHHIETLPVRFRGFAYEGAAMAFAVRDAVPLAGSGLVREFLAGVGDRHVYMAYVGIGWAAARLPRLRRPPTGALDPLLRWLVLDGYGFHQAYFHTRRYVHECYQPARFGWPDGPGWYVRRAIDQGIGRAMWFVGGTDADLVATMIDRFPAGRRGDLYSGAGLAATYAGGADEAELVTLRDRAGQHRPMVAQAAAFAAEARLRAGLLVPHNELATQVLCGTDAESAALLTRDLRPGSGASADGVPAYEVWRRAIAREFAARGVR